MQVFELTEYGTESLPLVIRIDFYHIYDALVDVTQTLTCVGTFSYVRRLQTDSGYQVTGSLSGKVLFTPEYAKTLPTVQNTDVIPGRPVTVTIDFYHHRRCIKPYVLEIGGVPRRCGRDRNPNTANSISVTTTGNKCSGDSTKITVCTGMSNSRESGDHRQSPMIQNGVTIAGAGAEDLLGKMENNQSAE